VDLDTTALPAHSAAAARYSYRCLTMAELPLLNDLYNACYQANRPLGEAEWLYRNSPNGPALIMAAFDEHGRLAGVRPAIPWKFSWRGQERTAYEFADALVAPQHRNRGIFTRLVKLICELAERNDFTLFTIPNGNSLPVYQRIPMLQVLGPCETRVKPISWPRYLGYRIGLDGHESPHAHIGEREPSLSDGDVRLAPVSRFDCDFAATHSGLETLVAGFTLRRKAFLQWRYFGSPVRQYRVALIEQRGHTRGYVVIRIVHRIAHLIDVFLKPDRQLACATFGLLIGWATQLGAIAIHFNASKDNFFHDVASQCGFWLKKTSGTLVLDRRSAELFAAGRSGHLEMAEFYFVMGDFDFL